MEKYIGLIKIKTCAISKVQTEKKLLNRFAAWVNFKLG